MLSKWFSVLVSSDDNELNCEPVYIYTLDRGLECRLLTLSFVAIL